jgi:hypothetical protein
MKFLPRWGKDPSLAGGHDDASDSSERCRQRESVLFIGIQFSNLYTVSLSVLHLPPGVILN